MSWKGSKSIKIYDDALSLCRFDEQLNLLKYSEIFEKRQSDTIKFLLDGI